MELNPEYEEFIDSFWIFKKRSKLSYDFREIYTEHMAALGLPILKGRRRKRWGFIYHPTKKHILLPVENDLKVLKRALIMWDTGDYFRQDIFDWINACNPSTPITPDIWKYNARRKPLYDEIFKPFKYRVSLVTDGHEVATPSKEEEAEEERLEGAEEAPRGTQEEKG